MQSLMKERALRRVYELLPNPDHKYCAGALDQFARLKNSVRKFKLITEATDREQMKNYLAEVRYALIFQFLAFAVEAEPLGNNTVGPDFRISRDGDEAYVEVRRFHPTGGGPPVLRPLSQMTDSDWMLEEYGNLEKEIRKVFHVTTEKFRQLHKGNGIVAFWNSDEDLDEVSLEHAVRWFIDYPDIHPVPPGLSFVVFGSQWRQCRTAPKLYCFPVRVRESLTDQPNERKNIYLCWFAATRISDRPNTRTHNRKSELRYNKTYWTFILNPLSPDR